MATRKIQKHPPDLTKILFELGRRVLVLVEGPMDQDVFGEWYRDRLSEIQFEAAGGEPAVRQVLDELLRQYPRMRAFGILDRDFKPLSAVQAPLDEPTARLFVLRRFHIENYLLEPAALAELHRISEGSTGKPLSAEQFRDALFPGIVQSVVLLAASDWVLHDATASLLTDAHDPLTLADLAPRIAGTIGTDENEAAKLLETKSTWLQSCVRDLESAHEYIRGKRLLDRIWRRYGGFGLKTKDQLLRSLANAMKHLGIVQQEIREIIEERILASPANPPGETAIDSTSG